MNLCAAKETISKMRRSLTNWEKIFENDLINNLQNIKTDTTIQLKKNTKHTNTQLKNGQKILMNISPKNMYIGLIN